MFVSGLQLDNICMGNRFEVTVRIEAPFGILIERLEVSYLRWLLEKVREAQVEFSYEHAELCAPVADMVDSEHVVALELEYATDTITLNR